MLRYFSIGFMAAILVMYCISMAEAGFQWLFYHADEIKGIVVDVDTKEPVDGAIVVGMWRLTQVPGEGFGGYAKVQVVTTDKDGNFTIPSWSASKPWKLDSVVDELAPKIIIYKPGYKVYWSHKVMREGFPDDKSKTQDEKNRLTDEYSITPAKLRRVHTDEERLANYDEWGTTARFPNKYFTEEQSRIIFDALGEELSHISDKNKRKESVLRGHNKLREYWSGGNK